jgi:formyl-CoA transferase/CoA:oxalate CoA-transferase
MRRILQGILVIDLTHLVAGPVCTRMLADLGADVITIHRIPGSRAERPPRVEQTAAGKRSLAVDLRHPRGLEIVHALAREADILVENQRPGSLGVLGLDYATLSKENPRLVYAAISGFGASNSRTAFGATAHAEAGFLWLQQQATGATEPFAPGLQVADLVTGMNAFSGILAALYDRERTGRGQLVDVSLMDSQLAMLGEIAGHHLNAPPGTWNVFRHPIHRSRDGRHFTINVAWPHNWARLARALGHPEMQDNRPEAPDTYIGRWVAELDADDIARRLDSEGAPYGLVLDMESALRHPHFQERGMIADMGAPGDVTQHIIRNPIFFSEADAAPAGPARRAGESTSDVLITVLGLSPSEVQEFIESGAVAQT